MTETSLDDKYLIQRANEMKNIGMLVYDISKTLSNETGRKITQMALWRIFKSQEEEPITELVEYQYPTRKELENLFSEAAQKESDRTGIITGGEELKRRMLIRILNKYINTEFTYNEVRVELNNLASHDRIYAHFKYLYDKHYIEKTENEKFRFCDRVRKWRTFGQL